MTLTVRSATVTGATTKGSALTHVEMDANWEHLKNSANHDFTQSGSGAVSTNLQDRERLIVYVEDFLTASQIAQVQAGTSTDISTGVGNALTKVATYGTLVFGVGSYQFNVDFAGKRPIIQGQGMDKTIIQSFAAAQASIVFGANGQWEHGQIRDLTISGASGTRTKLGVQFGRTVYQTSDETAGRIHFKNVKFIDLDKCVAKLYGNIGNVFVDCVMGNANYHFHAVDNTSPIMHAGADFIIRGHYTDAQLAHFYFDSDTTGTGLVASRGAIVEGNPGFVFFVKNFNNDVVGANLSIEDLWDEANYTAVSVTIDSVAYTPQFARFANCRSVTIKRSSIGPMTLVASTIHTEDCFTDTAVITKDSDSSFFSDHVNGYASNGGGTSGYNRSIKRSHRTHSNGTAVFVVPQRKHLSSRYASNALVSHTFRSPLAFTGTATINTISVADGTMFDVCQQLTNTGASQNELIPGNFNATSGKYIVFTIDVKKQSGDDAELVLTGPEPLFGRLTPTSRWQTFAGLTKMSATVNGLDMYCVGPSSGTCVLRFGAYQVLQFDTLQEAIEFLDSEELVAPAVIRRVTTAVGNVGAGEDDLQTVTLPASSLWVHSGGIQVKAWGTNANNANAKTVKLYFGSAVLSNQSLTTSQAGTWEFVAEVLRTGANAQDYRASFFQEGATEIQDVDVGSATQTETSAITVKCTGEATSNNDIVHEGLIVEPLD